MGRVKTQQVWRCPLCNAEHRPPRNIRISWVSCPNTHVIKGRQRGPQRMVLVEGEPAPTPQNRTQEASSASQRRSTAV